MKNEVVSSEESARPHPAWRAIRWLGWAIVGVAIVFSLMTLVRWWTTSPGPSQADAARLEARAMAELAWDALVAVPGPGLLIAARVLGRRK